MVCRGTLLLLAATLAVAAGGCGTRGEEEVVIADPLAEGLAYAPAGAAVLAVVATDTASGPGATLAALGARFPGFELVLAQGQATLGRRLGLEWATEVRPLLGHPLVLWSPDGSTERRFAAWVVRDAGRLVEVLEARVTSGVLREAPPLGEFTLFTRRGGGAYARRGPVLVSAPDLAGLREVLEARAASRGRWSRALLGERGLGLPEGAVARVAADAGVLLRRSGSAIAAVPWAGGLDRASLTLTPVAGGLRVRARVSTDPRATPAPLASGVAPPGVRGRAPVVVGVRDPRQTVAFVRAAIDRLDPERLAGLRRAEDVLGRYARVSVQEDLLDRLTGTATLTTADGRLLTLRADLDDPERTADALGRVGALARFGGPLASLAGVDLGGLDVDERDGRYALTQDGELLVALQVVDGALVASNDPEADLVAAGRASAGPPAPTAGALRATVAARLLQGELVRRLGLPGFARGALTPLGDAVLTALAEPGMLDAQLVLPVR